MMSILTSFHPNLCAGKHLLGDSVTWGYISQEIYSRGRFFSFPFDTSGRFSARRMYAEFPRCLWNKFSGSSNRNDVRSYMTRRFPVLTWLPGYKASWLFQDFLAGITVGLTAIPQGIAYGSVAGLDPEYGLYAAFMGCFVYVIFGSCKNITIGPTAIMALMVHPLVENYGPDMAVLICFLKGCIITLLGVFHLGFLLDFISLPVITGFTSGAAITIASSQFTSLLGISGKNENIIETVSSILSNLGKINIWDIILGVSTITVLLLLKNIPSKRSGTILQRIGWLVALGRNALVVILGAIVAYIFHINGKNPFHLTGSMGQGLPPLSLPPFSTTFNNQTYNFIDMTRNMGSTLFTIPIISTIEHIAIAKAFAKGKSLDATQEMLALGICNMFGSFVRSMPVTGSFTRTAVNHASGVRTPLGGIFTGLLVLLAVGLLTNTFQFIPKATLAGVIMSAMYYMLDFKTYHLLWIAKKLDFFTMIVTLVTCIFISLEIGIVVGVISNLAILLYFSARPSIQISMEQVDGQDVVYILPEEAISYPAAENLRANIMRLSEENSGNVILDCKNLKRIDVTVAKNMKLLAHDLKMRGQELIFVNSTDDISHVFKIVAPKIKNSFNDSVDF